MREYHMTYEVAMKFPLVRAHALCAAASLHNPWVAAEIIGPGYIAQEAGR